MTNQENYTPEEKEFVNRLESFCKDIENTIAFFFAFLSIRRIIIQNEKILKIINKTPFFWTLIEKALINSFYISLAKIFDQKSHYNLDKLIKFAQKNIEIFSCEYLKKRKSMSSPNSSEWLKDYMKDVYVPKANDFRRLKKYIKKYRKIYKDNYEDIRNKILAHREIGIYDNKERLFSKTNIQEIERILMFLYKIYFALWQMFHNGRKPVLRSMKYSVKKLLQKDIKHWESQEIQKIVIRDTKAFFKMLSNLKIND